LENIVSEDFNVLPSPKLIWEYDNSTSIDKEGAILIYNPKQEGIFSVKIRVKNTMWKGILFDLSF
jgi:hypothetical protein